MPKATLEFSLPEEQAEFEMACAAGKLASVLDDVRQELRSKLKHGDLRGKVFTAYEDLQRLLFQSVEDNGVGNIIN